MANVNFDSMTSINVARLAISSLRKRLIPIMGLTMDLSGDVATQGTEVKTRIVGDAAAAQDLVDDHAGDYDLVVSDTTLTEVKVTLDPHPTTGFFFTDTEAQEIAAGVWSDTLTRLIRSHVYVIADAVLNDVFNLITAANFGAAAFTGAASVFDADDVADIGEVATDDGWDLEQDNNSLVLKTSYHTALEKDNQIQDKAASGADTLNTGILPPLSGFKIVKAPTLPPAGGTPAAENLTGFAARPDGIAIAMRGVDTQAEGEFLFYEILVDEMTGVVMTYSVVYNRRFRRAEHIFEALYGVKKANGQSIKRIVSA